LGPLRGQTSQLEDTIQTTFKAPQG
jgi:hypothetical protein